MLASSAVLTIVANVMPTLGSVLGLVGMGIGTIYAILPTDRQDPDELTDAEYLVFLLSGLGLVVTAGLMSGFDAGADVAGRCRDGDSDHERQVPGEKVCGESAAYY